MFLLFVDQLVIDAEVVTGCRVAWFGAQGGIVEPTWTRREGEREEERGRGGQEISRRKGGRERGGHGLREELTAARRKHVLKSQSQLFSFPDGGVVIVMVKSRPTRCVARLPPAARDIGFHAATDAGPRHRDPNTLKWLGVVIPSLAKDRLPQAQFSAPQSRHSRDSLSTEQKAVGFQPCILLNKPPRAARYTPSYNTRTCPPHLPKVRRDKRRDRPWRVLLAVGARERTVVREAQSRSYR